MKNINTYKYVAVLGIDGMGNFNRMAETPRMDEIFSMGAVTYNALSLNPTISAQNWGAMLLGASPMVHGLTNSIIGRYEYKNRELRSIFARIREEFPDAYLASYCNWSPINYGIIEHDIDVDFFTEDNDELLVPYIVEAVAKKPKFLFVQLDDVDGAGHHYGYGTQKYLDEIQRTDTYIGRIYDAYKDAGIIDETLILVIADHGGIRNGHGGYMDTEKYIFIGACGKNVPHGEIGTACTKDIAAIVMYALGLEIPDYNALGYSSQVPTGIFPEITDSYFVPEAKPIVIASKPTPAFDGKDGLTSVTDKDKIKLALFFDDSLNDETGANTPDERGLVKYYSNGVRGSYGEFGVTGNAVYESVKVGSGSFTMSLWLRIDRSLSDTPPLFGNRDWWDNNRRGKGFTLAMRNADTVLGFGNGKDSFDFFTTFPEDVSDAWIHTLIAVDKEQKELRCYYNFTFVHKMMLEEQFLGDWDSLPFTVGDDAIGKYNREDCKLLIYMDDLFLFDGVLSDDEIKKLAAYYGK